MAGTMVQANRQLDRQINTKIVSILAGNMTGMQIDRLAGRH